MRVVIVGAGLAGVYLACRAHDDGHDPILLERPSYECAGRIVDRWVSRVSRRHHVHALAVAGYGSLMRWLPDVRQDLLDAGAQELDVSLLSGKALRCQRSTIESALRAGLDRRGVVIQRASPVGIESRSHSGLVDALRLSDGGRQSGEVFVDASGASGVLADLVAQPDRTVVEEAVVPLSYGTFWLAEVPGWFPVTGLRWEGSGFRVVVTAAEHNTASMTVIAPRGDPRVHQLRSTGSLNEMLKGAVDDEIRSVVEESRTLRSPVWASHLKTGRLASGGRCARFRNLVSVGDALVRTNPVVARGMSLAFCSCDSLIERLDDTEAYQAWAAGWSKMWFEDTLGFDASMVNRLQSHSPVSAPVSSDYADAVVSRRHQLLHSAAADIQADDSALRAFLAYTQSVGNPAVCLSIIENAVSVSKNVSGHSE